MAKHKDPAFLFYASDFLTGTMFMTNEQVGIYIRLLCSQHQHGGMIDKVSFNSMVGLNDIIRTKFIETDTGFYNIRLMEEMSIRNKKSNNMSKAAFETWEKRKNTIVKENDTIVSQLYYNSNTEVKENNTIVIQPENENRNESKDIKKTTLEDVLKIFKTKRETIWTEQYIKIESQKFYDFYSSKGWMIGKNKMKSLSHAVSGWATRCDIDKPENKKAEPIKGSADVDDLTPEQKLRYGF